MCPRSYYARISETETKRSVYYSVHSKFIFRRFTNDETKKIKGENVLRVVRINLVIKKKESSPSWQRFIFIRSVYSAHDIRIRARDMISAFCIFSIWLLLLFVLIPLQRGASGIVDILLYSRLPFIPCLCGRFVHTRKQTQCIARMKDEKKNDLNKYTSPFELFICWRNLAPKRSIRLHFHLHRRFSIINFFRKFGEYSLLHWSLLMASHSVST